MISPSSLITGLLHRSTGHFQETAVGSRRVFRKRPTVSAEHHSRDVRHRLEQSYRRLAETRKLRPAVAILQRFIEIDGGTLGILVSVLLFTTVIPLMLLGFSYFHDFAENISPGTIWIRELGLVYPISDRVRAAFGDSAGLRSNWTLFGVAGFLVWGVPMAAAIAGIFARAWRRAPLELVPRVVRGSAWFVLYLAMMACRERIAFGTDHTGLTRVLLFTAALVPVWIFWSLTPVLLVRDGGRGFSYLALAGLAGVVIDGTCIPVAGRLVFPTLLEGWNGFGPMGVAMALLTWCGVIGTGWVITACVGAVLWERNAPSKTVVESQTRDLSKDGFYRGGL